MEYRQGDVRDEDALRAAFDGADVVVHLAFLITGNASRETTRSINVDGTLNVVPCGGRRRGPPVRLRLLGRGVRLPSRQPGHDRRGVADPPGGQAVLRPGEGRGGGPPRGRGGVPSRPGAVPAAPADRPGAPRRRRQGPPAGTAGPAGPQTLQPPTAPAVPGAGVRARAPHAVHPRGGRRAGAGAVHRGRRAARRLQHRRRRHRHRVRRGAGVRRAVDPAARPARRRPRPARSPGCRSCRRPPSGSRRSARPVIVDTTKARERLGWRPRYTGLEALRDTLRDGS